MHDTGYRAIAIVGAGAVLPDAPNVPAFWKNIKEGRYSISEVTPDRWDSKLFYDADRSAPDKTYSKIGGWVREDNWDPLKWHMPIPPRVSDAMDGTQRWAISCTREALADYGYPDRPLNTERTAVILGNAMAGEKHYLTSMRVLFPEYARELEQSATFAGLPESVKREIRRQWHDRVGDLLPPITEDTMPGELSNCLAGRIANLYNFHGPNFVCDAACASTMAAMTAAVEGLVEHDFDAVITGGVDRNMSAHTFVKFCKIGALSATGSRPYAEGADGFVMGEGAALFIMKRLADAERDGDRIYAVLRAIGGSSDGKGKGITAPNPIGQKICVERAWETAGLSPATATLIEGHGTSTTVGDVVEVQSLIGVLKEHGSNGHQIALGSVKSNIGHLKSAAAAAGILKTALALRDKVLPPSVRCEQPNPNIDFAHAPLFVNTELRPWKETVDGVRRAGVSAFGFGGTNFHAVLEEYVPHRIHGNGKRPASVSEAPPAGRMPSAEGAGSPGVVPGKPPLRGALVAGSASEVELAERLRAVQQAALAGRTPTVAAPLEADLRAPERIAIDYGNAAELAEKCGKAIKALEARQPSVWAALRAQGIFRGHGPARKVAFLYPGQGSQYANMMRRLRDSEPIVADTFAEADRTMTPLLGKSLSDFIFVDTSDPSAVARAEEDLRQTAITQPAVLAVDLALTRMLEAYGIRPDMAMGHSLGEYGALVAAGALPFADALEAVSARGREMTRVSVADNGRMAAVFAPLAEIERILKECGGYVVVANYNSSKQAVIGGDTASVTTAIAAFQMAGFEAVPLPVSHAFHTSIVAPASEPLLRTLERLRLEAPRVPVVANVDGAFYPMNQDARATMLHILARQVASPVQFIKGLKTLYDAGARVFVEVGPKKALFGFVEDVLADRADVTALFTNHPKFEDPVAFNQALCGLYAAGLGNGRVEAREKAEVRPADRAEAPKPVVITGASVGLPGVERIFDDGNIARILKGEQFIDVIPTRFRRAMLDKHITRLVKSDNGGPTFAEIREPSEVIKLAARGGAFDLGAEFGVPAERVTAFDRCTKLAIGAGIDALRDAGIPLTMRYKNTTTGTRLPERWGLPDVLRDDTGVIFACVFPGFDSFAGEADRYYQDRARREQLAVLEDLSARTGPGQAVRAEIDRRIAELKETIAKSTYSFDRRFLFHVLAMGHSQFAEWIGARGPNSQVNAACASTTQAVSVAEDWIRAGRCRRVIIVSADDITSENLIDWFGAGFLASGAAATDDVVEDAAIPFDRRRHGMIMGMGAAALMVESAEAAAERGIEPICEVLSAVTSNSAFHGTRLDVDHIRLVMEKLVAQAERNSGIGREELAASMVFVSHETYTPARGGSASAEIHALRSVFGPAADRIIIANTKGFTGHAMGTGIEDVVAVKALETGCIPPVANFKEVDPELGALNLSRGGAYPVKYALRLGAGFGSQISMTLLRRTGATESRPAPNALGYQNRIADHETWRHWLEDIAGHPADLEVVQRTLRVRDGVVAEPVPAEIPEPAVIEVSEPRPAGSEVKDKLLELVTEKTGYPKDMLALDLDLEADLGIDTVKQAELFAAIREIYGIPRDPNLKLRDFPTLARVIDFVYERRPDLRQAPPVTATPSEPRPLGSEVKDKLLELVTEKTGYPKDMLALDLDLEADLGIDTVKQAELFAAIREIYGIPRDPNLKLRDFPTLARVIDFVYERRPDLKGTPLADARGSDEERTPIADTRASAAIPRRVPVPVLRPALDACKPTPIQLGPGKRVFVAPDHGGVAEALTAQLQALGVEVVTSTEDTSIDGVYWLPALDYEGDMHAMTLEEWHAAVDVRVKTLYRTMRGLYDQIASESTFLVSAVSLGGQHGYDDAGAHAPLGGAVSGFTKAYKRERPDVLVKAVDFETTTAAEEIARSLIAETLRDPGAVEIGYARGHRWTIGLETRPAADGQPGQTLDRNTVFVVTGAAGSIVSAITADLAAASGGTFHLLDLIPQPEPNNPDLQRFRNDKEALKRDLFARIQARGERATPALIERELAALERAQAAQSAIDAVRAAGGTACYYSANLADGESVAKAVADIRRSSGRIDVLLHAAGIERSHPLSAKEPGEFDLVFDVKSDGCFHLLHAIGDMPLGTFVAFSSIAGRFGNAGQTDYSAANDLLCKVLSKFRRTRPETRGLAIDWTAWGGIGMATRGSIPKIMEAAGIEMLPAEIGVPWIRRELTSGGATGEVVAAGALGILAKEWDPAGGLAAADDAAHGPMIGSAKLDANGRLTVETTLDPAVQPFLHDHAIEGTPLLPGVMGIEAFAEAANLVVPGWQMEAVEDVDFLAPFKFYRGEPRVLTLQATFQPEHDGIAADCELVGRRTIAGQQEVQSVTHFTGKVRLAKHVPEPPVRNAVPTPEGPAIEHDDIYGVYFHGPAYQVLKRAWCTAEGAIGEFANDLPDHHHPAGRPLAMAPRLIELCFQTAGLWEMAEQHRMGLPRHVQKVSVYRAPGHDAGPLYAVVTPKPAEGRFDAQVVDASGVCYVRLEGYRTVVFRENVEAAFAAAASVAG